MRAARRSTKLPRPSGARPWRALRLAGFVAALALALAAAPRPAAAADCPDDGIPCAATVELGEATAKAADKTEPRTAETAPTPKSAARPARNEIRWFFRNRSGGQVQYQLYSMDRNWSWPGGDRAFVLPANGQVRSTLIQCRRGELVCYGAWRSNNRRISWGVGFDARFNCRDCCFTCNGVSTPTFVLRR